MKLVEPWFGRWDDEAGIWQVLSIEFGIEPKIHTINDLERYIRKCGENFQVEIRYADEPYGNAGAVLRQVLEMFERIKNELGEKHFNYILLPREQVTLDFRPCKYMSEVFGEMRTKMDWDDGWGENLSALWDILWGMPYKGDDFTIIRPRWFTGIPHGENEAFTNYVDKICSIFQRAENQGILTVQVKYTESESDDNSPYIV